MIYDNIRTICEKKNISIKQVERELGFSNSSICKWNECEPSVWKVQKVADYGKHKTMYNLKEYLERYIQWPQIEMFVKMGLYHIAESIVACYCGIIADQDAIKPECFLGVYKRRLRDLKTLQGNLDYLKMWQMEKRMGLHLTVQESVFLAESQIRQNDLEEILKYTTVAKFMHRIEQYSGCEIPDTMQEPMCGRAAGAVSGVIRTYVDYLHMRIQRGYDLHNQIFLFPRDLRLPVLFFQFRCVPVCRICFIYVHKTADTGPVHPIFCCRKFGYAAVSVIFIST